ncbi:hypothetical protein RJT34_00370 [Clitoria ternatea]|uniref:Uncharacterized protein n=1 Tax=Clitoria ternatea TaxID=43366 RepID=A0AAN9KI85_CLITE
MEGKNKHSHIQPFIPFFNSSSTTTTSYSHHKNNQHHHDHDVASNNTAKHFPSDNNNIILRILLVLIVATISIWANYEASKTFDINIVNDAEDSPAGHRFALSYVSNDKATRIVFNTSSFVEHLLYPNSNNEDNHYTKKHIDSVTLRLARRNLNTTAAVYSAGNRRHGGGKIFNSYVIEISPMLLEDKMFNKIAIVGVILRGMAKVWIWDGGATAPSGLVDGMAEYVAELAGFRRDMAAGGSAESPECVGRGGLWWEGKDPTHVARLLRYCENYKKGFIQRLNEAMRDTWHDRMVDELLGMPIMELCGLYNNNASWVGLGSI